MTDSRKEKILTAFDDGKLYAPLKDGRDGERRFAFPHGKEWNPSINTEKEEAQELAKYFDNCTVFFFSSHIEVWDDIICPKETRTKEEYDWRSKKENQMFIVNGNVYDKTYACNDCRHFLKSMVGECNKYKRKIMENKEYLEFIEKPSLKDLIEIKRGYIKEYEFSRDIIFTRKNIAEQIDHYQNRGRDAKKRNKVRKETCIGKNCLKYKTETCPKGWRDHKKTDECLLNKDLLLPILDKNIAKDFGTFENAYWYFSQCDQEIRIKDPITKRFSTRLIAVPAEKNGGTNANGFFLAMPRYPFGYGEYHRMTKWRYNPNDTSTRLTRHDSFLSVKKYKKDFSNLVREVKYNEEKHKELVYAIYAIYKVLQITPGKSRYIYKSHSEYDIALSITGDSGKYRYGNSAGIGAGSINNLQHIFDYFDMNIKKIK